MMQSSPHEQKGNTFSPSHLLGELGNAVWTFSVLVSAMETGILEALTQPKSLEELSDLSTIPVPLASGLLDVLVASGLLEYDKNVYRSSPALLPLLQPSLRNSFFASLRTTSLQSQEFLNDAKRRELVPGWFHTDPQLLQAQGASGGAGRMAAGVAQGLFPHLPGLLDRFHSPTATFLDVGTGVATIAIELCRFFPSLHAVGLEPQAIPLAEAHRAVKRTHLEERITLRAQRVEDLTDSEAFDLVWLPQMFMPQAIVEQGMRTTYAALRQDGWFWTSTLVTHETDLPAALNRLRTLWWGGELLHPEQLAALLTAANFRHVQVISPPPDSGAPTGMVTVVGQK